MILIINFIILIWSGWFSIFVSLIILKFNVFEHVENYIRIRQPCIALALTKKKLTALHYRLDYRLGKHKVIWMHRISVNRRLLKGEFEWEIFVKLVSVFHYTLKGTVKENIFKHAPKYLKETTTFSLEPLNYKQINSMFSYIIISSRKILRIDSLSHNISPANLSRCTIKIFLAVFLSTETEKKTDFSTSKNWENLLWTEQLHTLHSKCSFIVCKFSYFWCFLFS